MPIQTHDNHGPIPQSLRDDGVPAGTITWGRNIGGTGKAEVLRKLNDSPRCALSYRYEVVMEVDQDWKARAIAAIVNAE